MAAHQPRPSLGFSRQEHWSGLPFPSPGDLPDPGIKPESPALQAGFLKHTNEGIQGKLAYIHGIWCIWYMHWLLKIKAGISVGQESINWHGINWHMASVLKDSLVAQMVKNLPAIRETWVRSLGPKDPLEKEIATHSSILAWKILWTEEPGGLQSIGSQRVGHNWATTLSWWCLTWLPQLQEYMTFRGFRKLLKCLLMMLPLLLLFNRWCAVLKIPVIERFRVI